MRGPSLLVVLAIVFTTANGFGGTEEKFIKKYAMMKVYESCFGLQVLKEVRKEMKEAALKCSGFQADFDGKNDLNTLRGRNSIVTAEDGSCSKGEARIIS